ncbi:MAG TPA: SprT family zinc-dependent metalloprotease [Gammaproteobacteria bacterium]|nr:SprT family zinc-dependent metalloprotease [Gammaproteobacteria bacterium]
MAQRQLSLFDGARPASGNAAPPSASRARAPLHVRESRRARRLTLRMLPPNTLELVVPRGTRPADVADFVRQHTRWIERARAEIAAYYPEGAALPECIELKAVAQAWPVRYAHEAGARPICRVAGLELLVRTRDAERRDAPDLLRSWLIEQARAHLKPWLLREANVVGVRPASVQLRLQRTRWGSCSSTGSVSLNAGLLFLAPELVRYLLIHELCHMIAMNHGRKFWRAVERFEPGCHELDRRLAEAWGEIPIWAHERAARGESAFDVA